MKIKPFRDGVIAAFCVFIATAIGISSLWWTASDELLDEVRQDLGRLSEAAAAVVDGDLHERLVDPEQMDGPLYNQALMPMKAITNRISGIKYLYTLRMLDGKVIFVLDAAEPGDNDGDGVEDRAALGEVYDVAIQEMMEVLGRTDGKRQALTTSEPYTDKWGSFMTGYAPIFNSNNEQVAVIGLDITVADYLERLSEARQSMVWGLVPAMLISTLLGYVVFRLRRKGISDLLEQQRLQSITEQNEKRFRDLFNSSPDPVWIIDHHHFVECNQAAVDMLGYPNKQVLVDTHPSELSPEYQPDGKTSFSKAELMMDIAQKNGINRFEWVHTRADKSDFWAEVTLSPFMHKGRQMIYCIWRDITERKHAEKLITDHQNLLEEEVKSRTKELEIAKKKAESSNSEKSRFLANMSHELRTPMHAIMSFSKLGLKHATSEKLRDYLEKINVSGVRLTKLLDDLLDLSKLESGKLIANFVMTDLQNLTQECLNEIDSLITQKGLVVNYEAEKEIFCDLDRKLIAQVIINLLSNAIKYSSDESQINIILKSDNVASGEVVRFSIQDEGIGIPQNEVEEVFDSFIQSTKTRTSTGGTGLGLPISREIISLHGGRIWAESPPKGKSAGSIFTFQIPVKQIDSSLI